MTAGLILDTGLVILVLGVAAWTVAAGSAFSAVVGFVAFGLLLAIAWVRLAAVDVALTEAAVGSGVTGAVLIAAAMRLRPTEPDAAGEWLGFVPRLAAAVLCTLVAAALAGLVLFTTTTAPTLAPAAAEHLADLGVGNAVTAVLLAYRSVDTLLEKVVLLLALVGVWSLAKDRFWGGIPGLTARADGSLVLLARLLPPVGIVVGIYILWVGADAPGGAFQGAAILAAMWILVMIAGLREPPSTSRRWLRLSVAVGPGVFLAIGFAGFALPGGFLSYPEGYAKPFIIAAEVALTFSIALILGLLVAGPPERDGPR